MYQCLNTYKDELRRFGTKPQYVKHFSTFMNNIEDYLEPEGTPPEGNKTLAQRVLAGEL